MQLNEISWDDGQGLYCAQENKTQIHNYSCRISCDKDIKSWFLHLPDYITSLGDQCPKFVDSTVVPSSRVKCPWRWVSKTVLQYWTPNRPVMRCSIAKDGRTQQHCCKTHKSCPPTKQSIISVCLIVFLTQSFVPLFPILHICCLPSNSNTDISLYCALQLVPFNYRTKWPI